jgi:Zn/Cd-binding protein ZinT
VVCEELKMKKILSFLVFMGCDFNKLIRNIKNFPTFISEYLQFKKQDKGEFKIEFRPMLLEKNSEGG